MKNKEQPTETVASLGADLITQERVRQITEEDHTLEDDAIWDREQLAKAALSHLAWYLNNPNLSMNFWPWRPNEFKPDHKVKIRNLTRAGALIAAEIDRLMRVK